jgi:hypothetical protein
MKKILNTALLLFAIGFSSCEKYYNCECPGSNKNPIRSISTKKAMDKCAAMDPPGGCVLIGGSK